MSKESRSVSIPLTPRAKKFGYIIWKKKMDPEIKEILGDDDFITLKIQDQEVMKKHIDWKQRRISITYKLTRSLSESVNQICLKRLNGVVEVTFI